MRTRAICCAVLALLVLAVFPAAAFGWCNGPDGPNTFGTHDWVLKEANRLAAKKHAGWVRLSVALPRTDNPDTIFHDTWYHCYDVWGSHYGNAPRKVAYYYGKALAARKVGHWRAASRFVGLMAHYYADICNPLHTDQSDAEEAIHSAYETAAQDYTDAPGENRAWVKFNGYTATTNVVRYTKRKAKASHTLYAQLVADYVASGMSAGVVTITQKSMNRAANGLADLIISIKRKVKGVPLTTTSSSATTVYITSTGSKYHRGSCSYLSSSKIAISLSNAKSKGYTACSVCDPPR